MSGWTDWHNEEINCPFCQKRITVLFVEEGSTEPNSTVSVSIASGKAICPECKNVITDSILESNYKAEPRTHFIPLLQKQPKFTESENIIFYAFKGFLWELEHNFTENIPGAEESLSNLVAYVLDYYYEKNNNSDTLLNNTKELENKLKSLGKEIWFES